MPARVHDPVHRVALFFPADELLDKPVEWWK
jgi:hypothetical protein